MFCPQCGTTAPPDAQFCPACGASLSSAPVPAAPLPSVAPTGPSRLTTADQLVLVFDKFSTVTNFQLQDASGLTLGVTQGEFAFPLKYTLYDDRHRVVLSLDATRAHGLTYDYLIHDETGSVLASLRQLSSFMSRKYAMTINGVASHLLSTDAPGYHYQVEETPGGAVIATGDRKPALRTSTTQISFTGRSPLDHRIVLGAMILACYLTTRR